MSLQNILNPDTVDKKWASLYVNKVTSDSIQTDTINITGNAPTTFFDLEVTNELKVDGLTDIGGNNYVTPDLGQPQYSLHTNGLGSCYWDVDSAGTGDISFNGIPPTIPGQLVKFSGIDGKTAEQSQILDSDLILKDGSVSMSGDLDLGNNEIKNCSHLNGMEITPAEFIINPRSVQTFNMNVQAVLNTNVIEPTSLPWVRIEECEIEDRKIRCDNVDEKTLNNGVNVDGVLLKDGLVDNVDVASFKNDYDSKVNQDVKNTASPTFFSLGLESDLTIFKAVNTPSAPGVNYYKSRGTISSPTAVLTGDILSSIATWAHDGTAYDDVAFIRTQATENHTPTARGTKMEFYTTNGISPTIALTLEQDGRATLGAGDNRYLLPNSSAGVVDGSVLAFNVATKDLEFKDKYNYSTQYGGNINNTGNYAVPQADPNFATNSTLDNTKEIIVPVDSYLEKLTYSTSTGDNTSSLQIVVDGLNPLQFTFTLGGAQGVLDIPKQPNRLLNSGARIAIRMNGGTSIGSANLTCIFRS
jgi:hypothetical protein